MPRKPLTTVELQELLQSQAEASRKKVFREMLVRAGLPEVKEVEE